jgi:hypothetical protein
MIVTVTIWFLQALLRYWKFRRSYRSSGMSFGT